MIPLLDGLFDPLSNTFLSLVGGRVIEVDLSCLSGRRDEVVPEIYFLYFSFTRQADWPPRWEQRWEDILRAAVRAVNLLVKESTAVRMFRRDDELRKRMHEIIGRRRVYLLFSGGKDSVAAYLMLKELLGEDAEIVLLHSYIERFEDLLEQDSAGVIEALGAKVVRVGVPESARLPTREERWCTELKMEAVSRATRGAFVAEGERIWESRGRFRSYIGKPVVDPPHLLPIKYMTNADAFYIAHRSGLLSRVYEYSSRASCTLCPFANRLENWIRLQEAKERSPESYEYFARLVRNTFGSEEPLANMEVFGDETIELPEECVEGARTVSLDEIKDKFRRFVRAVVSLPLGRSVIRLEEVLDKLEYRESLTSLSLLDL